MNGCCDYCGKPLKKEETIEVEDGAFCLNSDCLNMFYYEKEKEELEKDKMVW